jgi:hypothetical protein
MIVYDCNYLRCDPVELLIFVRLDGLGIIKERAGDWAMTTTASDSAVIAEIFQMIGEATGSHEGAHFTTTIHSAVRMSTEKATNQL